MVKEGSKWWAGDGKVFHVLHRIELEGHVWIHYILEDSKDPREFSCYEESFLARFSPMPE
jgi:hypothetical protein